jgi:hypothetical protein
MVQVHVQVQVEVQVEVSMKVLKGDLASVRAYGLAPGATIFRSFGAEPSLYCHYDVRTPVGYREVGVLSSLPCGIMSTIKALIHSISAMDNLGAQSESGCRIMNIDLRGLQPDICTMKHFCGEQVFTISENPNGLGKNRNVTTA